MISLCACQSEEEKKQERAIEWMGQGELNYNMGQYQQAVACFDQVTGLIPDETPAIYKRAQAKLLINDSSGALGDFNKLLYHDPYYENGFKQRSELKAKLKDIQGAIADLDTAIELDPERYALYLDRGKIKYEQRDYRGALIDFNHVLLLRPNHAEALSARGCAKYELQYYQEALNDFTKAYQNETYPDGRTFYNLGICYKQLKDQPKACEYLKKAQQSGHPNAATAMSNYCQ